MKHFILTVLTLLMGFGVWAQGLGTHTSCKMLITHKVTAPSCYNGMDAKVALQLSGGRRPYKIQWSDEGAGELRSGLAAGLYVATVSDADGCVKRYEVEVPQGNPIKGELSIKQQGKAGAATIAVLFADGSKPFAVNVKNLSEGVRAPWIEYKGQRLNQGVYVLEAFTSAGCSQKGRIDLRIQ